MPREGAALDRHRRPPVGGLDARAHRPQRRRHALHRPAASDASPVSIDRNGRPPARRRACAGSSRSCRRPAGAAARTRPSGPRPSIVTSRPVARVTATPSAARQRRVDCAVRGGGEVAERGLAVGQGAQERQPVGDGLVPGEGETAAKAGGDRGARGATEPGRWYRFGDRRRRPLRPCHPMTNDASPHRQLDIASRLDMLDMVQTVLAHLPAMVGFDDEASHYMSVAVRESVVNAIKHGNRNDEHRRVTVEFVIDARRSRSRCRTRAPASTSRACPTPSPRRTC